jgi:hypothetical protein
LGIFDFQKFELFINMDIDNLREIINELDHSVDGLCYVAIFSDHSGFIHDNFSDKRLGEFNNPEEMMVLINELIGRE